jgi:hypothetical protein
MVGGATSEVDHDTSSRESSQKSPGPVERRRDLPDTFRIENDFLSSGVTSLAPTPLGTSNFRV